MKNTSGGEKEGEMTQAQCVVYEDGGNTWKKEYIIQCLLTVASDGCVQTTHRDWAPMDASSPHQPTASLHKIPRVVSYTRTCLDSSSSS